MKQDKPTQEQIKEPDMERIERFHHHLDQCSQCRNNPFALCPSGAILLKYAATGKWEGNNNGR